MSPIGLSPLLDAAAAPELPRRVLEYARRERLFAPGEKVLVAVSGGPDSVALLHLLYRLTPELQLKLGVGHFDHGLRPDSPEDARFVAHLAQELGLPLHPGQGNVRALARQEKLSLQMAARRVRLSFLKETCRRHAYAKLALGHTADDQVELFFLRLLRGAGPEGLKGMWPATGEGLVRPLLFAGKTVLLAWLEQEGLPCRQDPGNLSRVFLRNKIRLDLLPELARGYNPRVAEAVWRAQALLQGEERLLIRETARAWDAVVREPAPDFFALNLAALFAQEAPLQKRVLRAAVGRLLPDHALTGAQVAGLLELARGGRSGGMMRLEECVAARAGPELHLFRGLPEPSPGAAAALPGEGRLEALGWLWEITQKGCTPEIPGPPETAWLDRERVNFPLEVHHFRPGDRFWPRGGPGPRKLQDFLVDRKVPRWLRPHLPLVAGGRGVIWVAGLEVAEPARARAGAPNLLKITITPTQPHTRRVWEILQAWRRHVPGHAR